MSAAYQKRLLLRAGFGGLLLLMLLLGGSAVSFLYQVQQRQEQIRQDYVLRSRTLERLRSDIYLSGTYVRDFLLDRAEPPSAEHFTQYRDVTARIAAGLRDAARQVHDADSALRDVRSSLDEYLARTHAVFGWNAAERAARSYDFTEKELLPRRLRVLGLTDRLLQLSEAQLETGSQAVSSLLSSFLLQLAALAVLALGLGGLLAGITLRRILRLENEAAARLEESARLSAELVAAQETERRKIARELHDEVGQTLYAAVLSLGNLRSALEEGRTEDGLREVHLAGELTERTARVVRNIALLLRPAILDDLGLVPALRWLAREMTRTQQIPVEVMAAEDLPELPEDHLTCVYRIVQESLHNAERHSGARAIQVELKADSDGLRVRVRDDGRGFAPGREGLGIPGMKERAQRLGGTVAIETAPGRGTAVALFLPLRA